MESRPKKMKKWTKDEIGKIIDYLEQNPKIEHPTAQVYYRKFLEAAKINASWHLVKFKVRYLRIKLKEAEKWRTSSEANLLELNESAGSKKVKEKLNKICPFFERLKAILISSNKMVSIGTADNLERLPNVETPLKVEVPKLDASLPKVVVTKAVEVTPSTSAKEKQENISKKEVKTSLRRDALSALSKIQEDRTHYLEKKMKLDEHIFNKKIEFRREKFMMQMDFKQKELDFKKFQLEQEIQQSHLKTEERLARYELELKYKFENKTNE